VFAHFVGVTFTPMPCVGVASILHHIGMGVPLIGDTVEVWVLMVLVGVDL